MHLINIRRVGISLNVPPAETILGAALAAGIPYPHGCKSGRCGGCKSRLISGKVELLQHTPFALTDAEKRSGFILACRAQPRTDCEVAWLSSDPAGHPVVDWHLQVVSLDDATHDIKVVRLANGEAPFVFSPGQYAELAFPNCPPRNYSMANLPGGSTLEFHVRRMPSGRASMFVAHELKVGDRVRVRGPFGCAHLRTDHTGPILAIAGGSGLAPIAAIVEGAVENAMRQPVRVYFGARTERDIYGEDRFRVAAMSHPDLTFTPVVSEDNDANGRRTGLVTAAVAQDIPSMCGWKAYVAGPPKMVEAATVMLAERGLRPDDVHADAFYASDDQPAAGVAAPIVAFEENLT